MNVCNLGKSDLGELNMIVKSVLQREGFHGKQSSDDRLYSKQKKGGRELKSFRKVYDGTNNRVPCYMAAATNELVRVSWRNEIRKEQISLKKEPKKVSFDEGSVVIGEES